jgi:hypothetical protein
MHDWAKSATENVRDRLHSLRQRGRPARGSKAKFSLKLSEFRSRSFRFRGVGSGRFWKLKPAIIDFRCTRCSRETRANYLALRRTQHSRPRSCDCLVEQIADIGSQELLGRTRLCLLACAMFGWRNQVLRGLRRFWNGQNRRKSETRENAAWG